MKAPIILIAVLLAAPGAFANEKCEKACAKFTACLIEVDKLTPKTSEFKAECIRECAKDWAEDSGKAAHQWKHLRSLLDKPCKDMSAGIAKIPPYKNPDAPAKETKTNPFDGDDPSEAMVKHMWALLGHVGANSKNCAKGVQEVQQYIDANRADLRALTARYNKMVKTMTPEQKAAHDAKMKKKSELMLKESMEAMMEFGRNCPQEMAQIGKAMESFKDEE
jgi:ElaB/YqjD/DUF883 family membrane-anchored ribosome-binding protein